MPTISNSQPLRCRRRRWRSLLRNTLRESSARRMCCPSGWTRCLARAAAAVGRRRRRGHHRWCRGRLEQLEQVRAVELCDVLHGVQSGAATIQGEIGRRRHAIQARASRAADVEANIVQIVREADVRGALLRAFERVVGERPGVGAIAEQLAEVRSMLRRHGISIAAPRATALHSLLRIEGSLAGWRRVCQHPSARGHSSRAHAGGHLP